MRKTNRNEKGFSLIETAMVIGVMMVLMGIAIVSSFGTMQSYQVNSAQDVVVSQLRVARQLAIDKRRTVTVWIDSAPESDGAYHVKYQVQPALTGTSEQPGPIVDSPVSTAVAFVIEPGVPDTPMHFGNNAAVYIGNPPVVGGPTVMEFTATGTFTDSTGTNLLYGTIFLGIPNQPITARAVTILGGTGRVRAYSYLGTVQGWQE
jgi:type II secretory pathway pseudopilin PulG